LPSPPITLPFLFISMVTLISPTLARAKGTPWRAARSALMRLVDRFTVTGPGLRRR
jgi:hypothetical protein